MIRQPTAALLLLAFCMVTRAETPPNTLTAREKAEGWELLFDGSSLNGWMSWKTKKPLEPGSWEARDGMLTLTGKGGGDIYTAGAYENYEFTVEWKTTGNSGLLLRVNPESRGRMWNCAPEIQINRGDPSDKKSTSAGGLYGLYDIEGEKVFYPDGWNKVRVRMVNGEATHWFNGVKTAEYRIGSPDWNTRVANSKFKKYPDFGLTKNGHLGFQDHGARVSFRNIRIRRL